MASRVGASIANATGFGDRMVVNSAEEYQNRAVSMAKSLQTFYASRSAVDAATQGSDQGALMNLRRSLFLARDRMPLFDTARWTRNLEKGMGEAWRRWVEGTEFEGSDEWEACQGLEKESGCIWVQDDEPITLPWA
jgi:protein O-GlcNAc transferase